MANREYMSGAGEGVRTGREMGKVVVDNKSRQSGSQLRRKPRNVLMKRGGSINYLTTSGLDS